MDQTSDISNPIGELYETGPRMESNIDAKTQSHDTSDSEQNRTIGTTFTQDIDDLGPHNKLPGQAGDFHFPWRMMFWGLLIAVGIGLVVWSLGQGGQQVLSRWFAEPLLGTLPTIDMLDVRNNRILMLESDGRQKRILVQEAGKPNWFLVSKDDYTAESPSISADGSFVAYRSLLGDGRIEVVSLDNGMRVVIGTAQLQSATPNYLVCSWSPIAWSADSQHVAFFACDAENMRSMALWTRIDSVNLQQITGTETQTVQPRQIQWLNTTQVSVSSPVPNSEGMLVTTHDTR